MSKTLTKTPTTKKWWTWTSSVWYLLCTYVQDNAVLIHISLCHVLMWWACTVQRAVIQLTVFGEEQY